MSNPLTDDRPVEQRRGSRTPQKGIPPTKAERDRLRNEARAYARRLALVPPLTLKELRAHASKLARLAGVAGRYDDFLLVLLSNAAWEDVVAGIPFERRLLLLPQCLRETELCRGEIDEFGLLCARCGRCPLHELQDVAEDLGYVVLVAEGTVVVTSLLESGKIDAVVGASCMATLERVFPFIEAGAIPGIAVPLLYDGCSKTWLDLDWLWDAIHLASKDRTRLLDLDALREEVVSWFTLEALERLLGPGRNATERLARSWLSLSGKRWRPFLALCAYKALAPDPDAPTPENLKRVAVAIECFHKASLIHDDIEDGDESRYGRQTLHREHGVPVALNAGDFLIGEGYRLIAETMLPQSVKCDLLGVASGAHLRLSVGQGEELWWRRHPRTLSADDVLAIFADKTAPAFEVALRFGAAVAGAGDELDEPLRNYSRALGTAYQIRDDLEDHPADLARKSAPSLLVALAIERAEGEERELLELAAASPHLDQELAEKVGAVLDELDARNAARRLLIAHKERAVHALRAVRNQSLKGLLRRVVGKIFNELEPGSDA